LGATVRQGTPATIAGLTIDFVREKRFSLLQVARNPGIPIFVAASLLLVGGLAVTFYFPHRRVRGIVAGAPDGGSKATLAPMARRDWSGQRAFARLLDGIEERVGGPVTRRERSEAGDGGSAPLGAHPSG
jgi:cytochrome c biogenesis protein ResB